MVMVNLWKHEMATLASGTQYFQVKHVIASRLWKEESFRDPS